MDWGGLRWIEEDWGGLGWIGVDWGGLGRNRVDWGGSGWNEVDWGGGLGWIGVDWGAVRWMLWQSSASCNGAFRRISRRQFESLKNQAVPPEQHTMQLRLLNSCGGSIQTQCSAPVAMQALSFLKIATTCRLIMARHCRAGVVASATRVLVVAFSAGSAVIGFAGTARCGSRSLMPVCPLFSGAAAVRAAQPADAAAAPANVEATIVCSKLTERSKTSRPSMPETKLVTGRRG